MIWILEVRNGKELLKYAMGKSFLDAQFVSFWSYHMAEHLINNVYTRMSACYIIEKI